MKHPLYCKNTNTNENKALILFNLINYFRMKWHFSKCHKLVYKYNNHHIKRDNYLVKNLIYSIISIVFGICEMYFTGIYIYIFISQRRRDAKVYNLLTIRVIPFFISVSLKLISNPSLRPDIFK